MGYPLSVILSKSPSRISCSLAIISSTSHEDQIMRPRRNLASGEISHTVRCAGRLTVYGQPKMWKRRGPFTIFFGSSSVLCIHLRLTNPRMHTDGEEVGIFLTQRIREPERRIFGPRIRGHPVVSQVSCCRVDTDDEPILRSWFVRNFGREEFQISLQDIEIPCQIDFLPILS